MKRAARNRTGAAPNLVGQSRGSESGLLRRDIWCIARKDEYVFQILISGLRLFGFRARGCSVDFDVVRIPGQVAFV
jgi:hypothetical protein